MNYSELMEVANVTAQNRGVQYGDMVPTMERISKIATLITGKVITAYDVAMVLHAVKLGRLQDNRNNVDNYVDGVNYLAFAGQFATSSHDLYDALEDDITAVARRFAPKRDNANAENNRNDNGGSYEHDRPDAPTGG